MKFTIVFAFCLLAFAGSFAQNMNNKKMDEQSKTEILYGYCDRSGMMSLSGDFGASFNYEWNAFMPDMDVFDKLKYKLGDIEFTIVLGTWCGDSKIQVPRFIKLLDCLKYDVNKVTFIAVDRNKSAGIVPVADLRIEKIPTIIVKRNGVEIGRIVESPQTTLEKDLLQIVGN